MRRLPTDVALPKTAPCLHCRKETSVEFSGFQRNEAFGGPMMMEIADRSPIFMQPYFPAVLTSFAAEYGIGGWRRDIPSLESYDFVVARCLACEKLAYYEGGHLVHPMPLPGDPPSKHVPEGIASVYQEAREIAYQSPRSASLLLRLAVDKLLSHHFPECAEPNAKGRKKTFDEKIRSIVGKVRVGELADLIRQSGNAGAHELGLGFLEVHNVDEWFEIWRLICAAMDDEERGRELIEKRRASVS